MRNTTFIILQWVYAVVLLNVFFILLDNNNMWVLWVWKISMFWMFLMLPIFVKFIVDDIEDEYDRMWLSLKYRGRIL